MVVPSFLRILADLREVPLVGLLFARRAFYYLENCRSDLVAIPLVNLMNWRADLMVVARPVV